MLVHEAVGLESILPTSNRRKDMSDEPQANPEPRTHNEYIGIGLALGAGIGAAIGNVGLGVALGLVFGAAMSRKNGAKES
jgi:hypothetical protein